jgi:hypothetical protein
MFRKFKFGKNNDNEMIVLLLILLLVFYYYIANCTNKTPAKTNVQTPVQTPVQTSVQTSVQKDVSTQKRDYSLAGQSSSSINTTPLPTSFKQVN